MAKILVSKEIPTGDIDGVNKVFTLSNTPSTIDDLWYDGAITTDYTLVGDVITMGYAPEYTIFVDYYTGEDDPSVISEDTLETMRDRIRYLLGVSTNSNTFNDDILNTYINEKLDEVLKGRVNSLLEPGKIYRSGYMKFMEGYTSFRTKKSSILTDEVSVGDTVMSCDTSTLLTAGYVLVGGDILKYTGKTSTTLTGVTGITSTHLEGDSVKQLYEMPVNFDKPNKVEKIIQSSELRKVELEKDSPYTYGYSLLKYGTTILLNINGLMSDDEVLVSYNKKFYDLVDDDDLCPLPGHYGNNVIAYLVAGQLGYEKLLPQGQGLLLTGYRQLHTMYQYLASEKTITKQSIKPVFYKGY